ncbi:MAG: hypothetical protein JKY61_02095 [Planctomycetes bacterium]|nr:hypothetical protein [Planctomycetota bacterium]
MTLTLSPKKVLRLLLVVIFMLFIANAASLTSRHGLGHRFDIGGGIFSLFNFDTESNIPSFYSALALVLACVLLGTIAAAQKKLAAPYLPWATLSVIFAFLSIDEIAALHERLIGTVRNILGAQGLFYFAWIIPYSIGLIILGIVYIRFLRALPKRTAILFVCSGSIFVLGAIGFEMLGGMRAEVHGTTGFIFALLYTAEESLEMLGIALFIYSLLEFIGEEHGRIEVSIASSKPHP